MKISFKKFSKLFLESILDEDKSRLIDRLVLPDINDEDKKEEAKEEMKAFFKKYNQWENKLDWNKLDSITYADFEKIKDQSIQTKGAQKREITLDIKNIFKSVGNRKFEIIGENDNWIFVSPLTYEAAVYCDSSENQGAGAKWCIGHEKDDQYWYFYVNNEYSSFIMAFNKNYKSLSQKELKNDLKYMIELKNNGNILIWNQADNYFNFKENQFDISRSELNSMFNKAKILFKKVRDEQEKEIELSLKNKIENLKNITEINDTYFTKERIKLTKIDIPSNITNIGNKAFYGCRNLLSVHIQNGIKNIGDSAFEYCKNLTSITIPDSVESIGDRAFYECFGLTNVIIGNGVTNIGREAFYCCENLKNLKIPTSVKMIGGDAFKFCSNLLYDTNSIPGVRLVDGWVIESSDSLPENLNLKGVRGIKSAAFSWRRNLKSVTIPSSVTIIGKSAFAECSNLKAFYVSSDNPAYKSVNGLLLTKDGKTLISGVNGDVVIPNGVINIENGAFSGYHLTSLIIPNSVTNIGAGAFSSCKGITDMIIPDSVTNIGGGAFQYCRITNLIIGNGVTDIGAGAFAWCHIKNIILGNNIKKIGKDAFIYCNELLKLIFKGKTLEKVKKMKYYPWKIYDPEKIIKVEE